MGTDIHHCFQAKINGQWQFIEGAYEGNRDSTLFAYLANVRNGFGFAGVPTHTPVKPISEPRGFPTDWAYGNKAPIPDKYGESCWLGDHSHSWLTADEILSHNYLPIIRTGVIPLKQYKEWDGKSPPVIWCGMITGKNVFVATSPEEIKPHTTHVQIEWQSESRPSYFLEEVQRLKDKYGEVRIIFGFDS